MNILIIKMAADEPEYYYAQSYNECNGIAENGNGYGNKFFETSFGIFIYIFHDMKLSVCRKHRYSGKTSCYILEIILRNCSLVFPTLACSLPNNSSSLPSLKSKSSSVRFANCCLSLPAVSFQFPLSFRVFIR